MGLGAGGAQGGDPAGLGCLTPLTCPLQYYYSIKDISVGGRCVCHGHADACDAQDPTDPFR